MEDYMYNKIILIGHLTRDIELRYLPQGSALAKSALATNRKFKNAKGEEREESMFIDFSIFGKTAEVAHRFVRKGSRILIEGRLVFDQWIDNNNQKRSKHSVLVDSMKMLDSKNVAKQESSYKEMPSIDIDDEEIPF